MNMIEELRLKHEVENEKLRVRERAAKIRAACTQDEFGRLVRGYVDQVRCSGCKSLRWNDGAPCKNVIINKHDVKIVKVCGHRVVEANNDMEDGRIG